ncbi:PTS glucose transporter subunit IIA, partial [Bacillus pseudomycoides]|uniref:PTS glucose transporter subunit IIA n=1 Tax=Bacillus pseudomycoides TaxID=64104 RepID=UPI000BFAF325
MLAPVAGRLLPLSAVPDQVIAGEMVGSGVAIEPSIPDDGADAVVVAPVAGTVLKL